ncbi:hypothetical protein J6S35_03690 [Candidatus Saccharibacteria bacterium]|nr:hypothetical protein [Candidatus Saccharibacteria bacterium]
MRKFLGAIISAVVMMAGLSVVVAPRVFAEGEGCEGIRTSIIGDGGCVTDDNGSAIFTVLNIVLQILTYGVGIVGTFGVVISGIQYMTAKDNAGQMAAAKTRLIAIAIGLATYAVIWAFLQWLLPGGIFGE